MSLEGHGRARRWQGRRYLACLSPGPCVAVLTHRIQHFAQSFTSTSNELTCNVLSCDISDLCCRCISPCAPCCGATGGNTRNGFGRIYLELPVLARAALSARTCRL